MYTSILSRISRIFSYAFLKKIQAVILLLVLSFHIVGNLPITNAAIGVIGTIITPDSPGIHSPDVLTVVGTKLYVTSMDGSVAVVDTTTNKTLSNLYGV